MMEYAFYFMLKVIVFKIIKYFGHAGNRYDNRAKFNVRNIFHAENDAGKLDSDPDF